MDNKGKIIKTDKTVATINIPTELVNVDVIMFANIVKEMTELYAKKNHDYGNSFEEGMNKIGMPYGIGRLYDKMNRILTLTKVKAEVTDESIEDTLKDLACYSVMTLTYLRKKYGKLY